VYKFSDLNHNSKCFKKVQLGEAWGPKSSGILHIVDWCSYHAFEECTALSLSPRSPRKAAYGTRDIVPLDSILATVYTVCKWWFLNTWCSWSSTHRWSSERKVWVSHSQQQIIFLPFQTLKMEEAH